MRHRTRRYIEIFGEQRLSCCASREEPQLRRLRQWTPKLLPLVRAQSTRMRIVVPNNSNWAPWCRWSDGSDGPVRCARYLMRRESESDATTAVYSVRVPLSTPDPPPRQAGVISTGTVDVGIRDLPRPCGRPASLDHTLVRWDATVTRRHDRNGGRRRCSDFLPGDDIDACGPAHYKQVPPTASPAATQRSAFALGLPHRHLSPCLRAAVLRAAVLVYSHLGARIGGQPQRIMMSPRWRVDVADSDA
ncbi:hypothetical protein C8Q78DRAFT_775796 [Trametes maxima]|nr:hypothetical protein C8Q78DRAFT_775796 [Trametes maxima]